MKLIVPFLSLFFLGCQVEAEKKPEPTVKADREFFNQMAKNDMETLTETVGLLATATSGLNQSFSLRESRSAMGYREAHETFSNAVTSPSIQLEAGKWGQSLKVDSNVDGVEVVIDYEAIVEDKGGYYEAVEKTITAHVTRDSHLASFRLYQWSLTNIPYKSEFISLNYYELSKMVNFVVSGNEDEFVIFGAGGYWNLTVEDDILTLNVSETEIEHDNRIIKIDHWNLVYDFNSKEFSQFEISGKAFDQFESQVGLLEYSHESGNGILVVK